jgi:heterotetrameric sarcosine oxidase delta subunit
MLINCPLCGPRDIREFTIKGDASYLNRPEPEAGSEAWDDYLHNRDNIAGVVRELWQHTGGCGAWLVVTRNTMTHEVLEVQLAREVCHAG